MKGQFIFWLILPILNWQNFQYIDIDSGLYIAVNMACMEFSDTERAYHYSTTDLMALKPRNNMLTLPSSTRNWISELGIKRRFRGHRGKAARERRVNNWNNMKDYNHGVHQDSLHVIPTEITYDNNQQCKFALVNTGSIRNKIDEFLHYVITEDLDFCI